MSDVCGDNRFEIIEAYKKKLIEDTNIETRPEEMAVIDNILLRFWQMGWLPSKEPDWIPCSVRLPEDYQDVLVWFEYYRYGSYNSIYSTHGIGTYSERYDSWMVNHESGWKDLRVIAWMPLPTPWKGEENE